MAVIGLTVLTQLTILLAVFSPDPKAAAVVRINGKAITAADVDFAAKQHNIPAEKRPEADSKLIEQLIDQQLIRTFLAARKIQPVADELQHEIARVEELIRKTGEEPKEFLTRLGYTAERLKSELGLPLAWLVYARRTITQEQLKEYFEQHRQELDGTQLRASQIFLILPKQPSQSEISERKEKLAEIRRDIVAGNHSFADAAKQKSDAPTAESGGDVGLFGWKGKLPSSVSQAAFALKVNEISEPIVSPFGVHLIQVTERHPGDYSLEDVRNEIFDRLSQQLWATTIAKERETAKIDWGKK